jgi:hypothetical protein
MGRDEAITRLGQLRAQTYTLETSPRLAMDFWEWYLHVLEVFDEIFGPASSARQQFEQIGFEFPTEWQQQGIARLRQVVQEQRGIDLPESFAIPLTDYHYKRFADARELFTSLIIELRTQ